MKITITNPINQEQVDIDIEITTNISTYPNGRTVLSVHGSGQIELVSGIEEPVLEYVPNQ